MTSIGWLNDATVAFLLRERDANSAVYGMVITVAHTDARMMPPTRGLWLCLFPLDASRPDHWVCIDDAQDHEELTLAEALTIEELVTVTEQDPQRTMTFYRVQTRPLLDAWDLIREGHWNEARFLVDGLGSAGIETVMEHDAHGATRQGRG